MMKRIYVLAVALIVAGGCSENKEEEQGAENNPSTENVEKKEEKTTGEPQEDNSGEVVELADPNRFMEVIKDDDVTLIDVRTPGERENGYIAGSININYSNDSFKPDLDTLDKSVTYAVYCHSGGRSGQTAQMMKEMGFTHVIDLDGGFGGWKEGGFPVEMPGSDDE